MATPMLELRDVSVRFGGLHALRDVSITVATGEIRAIIGPNGSGKTTLLNAISGLVPIAGGEILMNGKRIDRMEPSARARRGLGRTFQSSNTFGELSLIDNVRVGAHRWDPQSLLASFVPGLNERLASETKVTAMEYLKAVGLDGRRDEFSESLPYGQQRLLDFARVRAAKPDLILLDEPTAGLNTSEIDRLRSDLRTLRDLDATVVLIEHHMPFVMDLCDQVTVLDFGQVIASGTPGDVRADPKVIESYLGAGGQKLAERATSTPDGGPV